MFKNSENSIADSLYDENLLERKLQYTEQKYRNLFEHMSEGLAYCRMIFKEGKPEDWEYISVNAAFEKLTGLLNVTGKRVSEVIPGLKANDPELFEIYSRVSLTGNPEKFEIYVTSLKEWFQISVYSPEREYFISIFDVITERKFTEESFRKSGSLLTAAMKLACLGHWEYDIATDLFTFNDQFYSLLHTTAEKEGGYKMSSASYASRFVYPDDILLVEKEVSETIKTNDPEYNRQLEHRILYADGGVGYISVRFFASTNEKGRIIKTFGVNQDITIRRQYENNLKAAKEKAERSEKLKDAFIANISHEIRTPLNGVLGMTKLIRDSASKYLNEEENEFFDSIEWANKRIIRTVDMILNFSRIQIGDFPLKPQYINLSSVIQNLLNEYKHAAHVKGLDISFVNNAGNIELLADEYCIGQALSNLINNAVKYTNSGRIILSLQYDDNSDLLLNIEDSGIGISNEYLSHLFEPFTQEEVGYNRMYEGVGLGMSLVKKYLELNQAGICVKSKKNIGTVFTIKFQSKMLKIAESNREISAVSEKKIQGVSYKKKEKLSILLVEDDSINQMYIRSVCKKKYIISCVHNAAKALEALNSGIFDVILMDISLKGGMDGLELTKFIKTDPRLQHLPVIAVTGHTSSKDIQNCNAAGCSGFLAKPFSDRELLESIESVTNSELHHMSSI